MSQTVTAAYDRVDKATNAFHELVADGYAREEIFLDNDSAQIKVIAPDSLQGAVEEILKRHEPDSVWARPFPEQ